MLLKNILDKVVTMFFRPNLESQKLLAMTIFCALSAYLPPQYIFRKFPMLLYFLVIVNKLPCIPSSHYWMKKASVTTPAPDENHRVELYHLKRKIIWNIEIPIEHESKKKKSGARHHQSFRLNSKLSSSISS